MTEYIPESEGVWVLVEENSPSCNLVTQDTTGDTERENRLLQLIGVAAIGLICGFVIFGGSK